MGQIGHNCVGQRFLSCEQVLVCLTPASEDVTPSLDPSPPPSLSQMKRNPSLSVPFDFFLFLDISIMGSILEGDFSICLRSHRNHTGFPINCCPHCFYLFSQRYYELELRRNVVNRKTLRSARNQEVTRGHFLILANDGGCIVSFCGQRFSRKWPQKSVGGTQGRAALRLLTRNLAKSHHNWNNECGNKFHQI